MELSLKIVKALNGFFINFDGVNGSKYKVNERDLKKSYKDGWWISEKYPENITTTKSLPNINHRYELKDPINFPNLPQSMPREEVTENVRGYCEWKKDLEHLSGLYELVSDPQEPETLEVPFTVEYELSVDRNIGESTFSYSTGSLKPITQDNAKSYGIDEMFYPNIVTELLPCKLTSQETFDIIREHVKLNINPLSARVTSDYKFHFEVHKIIDLHEPKHAQKEILTPTGRSYKSKKYRKYTVTQRTYSVFNMYCNWRGYGPDITPFSGESHQDLQEKIDNYLKELMEMINTPLVDCPHCKGMGVIVK